MASYCETCTKRAAWGDPVVRCHECESDHHACCPHPYCGECHEYLRECMCIDEEQEEYDEMMALEEARRKATKKARRKRQEMRRLDRHLVVSSEWSARKGPSASPAAEEA